MNPVEFVRQHLARYGSSFESGCAAMREDFTDRTIWENVGLSSTVGSEQALALMHQFRDQFGIERIEIDTLTAAACGNRVLTERVDHLIRTDGSLVASIPLMGILEVERNKVVAWHDYFDTAGFQKAL